MGTDIHWLMERRHSDGAWEAVYSKFRSHRDADLHGLDYSARYDLPQLRFGLADYDFFGILSAVRRRPPRCLKGPVATEGLPDDCSEHALLNYGDNGDLHSHGHFTLAALMAAQETIEAALHDHAPMMRIRMRELRSILSGDGPYPPSLDHILFGHEADEADWQAAYPQMRAESNHARLQRNERQKAFLPITGDSLRLIIAYDN